MAQVGVKTGEYLLLEVLLTTYLTLSTYTPRLDVNNSTTTLSTYLRLPGSLGTNEVAIGDIYLNTANLPVIVRYVPLILSFHPPCLT